MSKSSCLPVLERISLFFNTLVSCVGLMWCRGHQEPNSYSGPNVTVLSSNITSSTFIAELSLSNATTWQDSGFLDITSQQADVIWALGTSAPSDPSNPDSDFQRHDYDGTFTIDMSAAQTTGNTGGSSTGSSSGSSPSNVTGSSAGTGSDGSSTGTKSGSAPSITGQSEHTTIGGLTSRQKVRHPFLLHTRADLLCCCGHCLLSGG